MKSLNRSTKLAIQKELQRDVRINTEIRVMIEKQFKVLHKKLISDFLNHPVTKELKGGTSSSNITNSLPEGNLFGFIGFQAGSDPTSPIQKQIEDIDILLKYKKFSNMGFTWSYIVTSPSARDLYKSTPMPWAQGSKSWLREMEGAGIPNLGQYMHKKSKVSRSEAGIQNTKKSGGGRLRIPYINHLLQSFESQLQSIDAVRASKKYF